MTAFLKRQRHWLVTERLPPYGHDLNPVEQVWGNLKTRELANLCPDSVEEAAVFADNGLMRIGEDLYRAVRPTRRPGDVARALRQCPARVLGGGCGLEMPESL